MKVSIITVTYNSSGTIAETLHSVATQNYPSVEHIVVDGASKDETLSIVRSFPHVKKVITEPDEGIYDAMNKGIGMASGDIIGILNSDDFYPNEKILERVVEVFYSNNVDSVYGDLHYVRAFNTHKIVRYWKAGNYCRTNFRKGWMPPHPAFFVKKNIYEQFGNFNLSLKGSADYELMLRFLYKHGISTHYLPKVLVKMRMGGHSNASILNRLKSNREDIKAWKINGLQPPFYTTILKPIRKISQYIIKFP